LRWTKKPANVIWYSADKADNRIAIPPLRKRVAKRKFLEAVITGKVVEKGMSLTKRVMASV